MPRTLLRPLSILWMPVHPASTQQIMQPMSNWTGMNALNYLSPECWLKGYRFRNNIILRLRQDVGSDEPLDSNCMALRDINSCGSSGASDTCTLSRRGWTSSSQPEFPDGMTPAFNFSGGKGHDLMKRIFKINPVSTRPAPINTARIKNYLSQQWNTHRAYDNQYSIIYANQKGFYSTIPSMCDSEE